MASSTTPTPEGKKIQTSDLDIKILGTVMKHTRGNPDVDWEAFAAEMGYSNANTAKVRFGQVKRKLGIGQASPGSSSGSPLTTPVKSGGVVKKRTPLPASGKKRTPAASTGKKQLVSGKKKAPLFNRDDDDDDDDDADDTEKNMADDEDSTPTKGGKYKKPRVEEDDMKHEEKEEDLFGDKED